MRASVFTRAATITSSSWPSTTWSSDGWSFGLLLDDLFQLYARVAAAAPPAAAAPAQYLDFVRWQAAMLAAAEGARLRTYWDETLAGSCRCSTCPPTGRARPSWTSTRTAWSFALDRSSRRGCAAGRREGRRCSW